MHPDKASEIIVTAMVISATCRLSRLQDASVVYAEIAYRTLAFV